MPVRFSTRCPNSDYLGFEASPEAIVAAAKKAEEVGFDAIFVNDHIIVDGSPRAAPWTNVYDPFVAMSFIAAHLLAALPQGVHADGKQPVYRVAHGRRLAR
jgi:hypothetical protein